MAELTLADALALVATKQFRPFERCEFDMFGGVESDLPLIHWADEADETYTIIIDGNKIQLIDSDGVGPMFVLGDVA